MLDSNGLCPSGPGRSRLQELGIVLNSEESLNAAFTHFKELADKKHEIFDEDLHALVSEGVAALEDEHFKLVSLKVCSETGEIPHAQIVISEKGEEKSAQADIPVVSQVSPIPPQGS